MLIALSGDAFERGAIAAVARTDHVSGDSYLQSVKNRLLLVLTTRSLRCNCSHIASTPHGENQLLRSLAAQAKRTAKELTAHILVVPVVVFEKRAELQQRFGIAVIGLADGQ
jgi:hypothetical protein